MPSTLAPIRKEIERSLGYGVAPAVLVFDAVQDVAEARGAIAPTSAMNDATLWTEPRFTAALFQEIRLQRTVDFETLRDMLSLCECAVKVLTVQQRASDAANKRVKLDTGKGTSAPSPRRAGATATTTPNLTIDDHRVTSLFCRAISSLVRDGAIFLQDPSRDLYQVIAHDLNLGIDLFKVIKTACKRLIVAAGSDKPNAMSTTTAAATGLKEDYIVATIHQYANGRYRHVSKTDIVASLERLVESTLIYECGFHTYRVL